MFTYQHKIFELENRQVATIRRRKSWERSPFKAAHKFSLMSSILLVVILLSSCGTSANSNGDQACVLVRQAESMLKSTPPKTQSALNVLRQALPLASIAAGTNGGWQPLEATLSETNRVAATTLLPALQTECSLSNQGNPNAPGSFQQANLNPTHG